MQRAQGPPSKQAFLPWMTWGLGAALQTPSSQGSAAPGLRVVPCPAGMLLDRVLPHPLSSQEETLQQVQRPLQVLGKGLSPPSPRTPPPSIPPGSWAPVSADSPATSCPHPGKCPLLRWQQLGLSCHRVSRPGNFLCP